MADLKISQLTGATTPLAGSEVVPLVQGSTTKKVSVANLTAGRSTSVSELISDDGVQGRWTVTQDAGGNKMFSTTPAFSGWRSASLQANGTGPNMVWGSDGNTTVGVGNVIIGTAGKGIDFSANTHAAGMTSELLDWYEEGTWTPTVTGWTGITYATRVGRYTRVGNQVTCWFEIQFSGTSGASLVNITGLPFTVVASSNGGALSYYDAPVNRDGILLYPTSAQITLYADATSGAGVSSNGNATGKYFIGFVSYQA